MKIYSSLATVNSVECNEVLQERNEEFGTERVAVQFSYVGQSIENADDITNLFAECCISNQYSVLIDIAGFASKFGLTKFEDKLAKAQELFLTKQLPFTTYVFDIAELNSEGHSITNNGEREYTTLSHSFFGLVDNESNQASAKTTCESQLRQRVADGVWDWGEILTQQSQSTRRR